MNLLRLLYLSALCALTAEAADTSPVADAATRHLQFADDFNRAELGSNWRITFPTFSIADGVLHAAQTKPEHSAVGMVKLGMKDAVIEFKFKLDGAASINAVCNDRDYKEGHAGHICRVSLSPRGIFLADDKERLRHEIEEMRKNPATAAEAIKRTAGMSRSFPVKLEPGHWYGLTMEVANDELSVSLDGKFIGSLKSAGIAHEHKTDFYFAVSCKEACFDEMKIFGVDKHP